MESREGRLFPAGGRLFGATLLVLGGVMAVCLAYGQEQGKTSYMKVDSTESFASIMARMTAEKAAGTQEHNAVLSERYDLSDRPAQAVTMDRGKPVQEGARVTLPAGLTWEKLAAMRPEQLREHTPYPHAFYPS